MRIAICDDFKFERQKTVEALNSVVRNILITEFENGNELLAAHKREPFDLIMLDIIMPQINGIETAELLRKTDKKTPVIFVSTSEKFGVQSYRVLAFDYLLKPIDITQLRACMKRLLEQNEKVRQFLSVTYSGTETKILLSNIQFLESNLRKVIITLSENREIEITGKLTDFEEYLLEHGFLRCHKSFIVNIEHIDRIEDEVFYLTGGKSIKISRTYLHGAKKAYFDYVFSMEV